MFEFGDSGGLLVIAQKDIPTDHVLYSFDEGLSWNTKIISPVPLIVTGLSIQDPHAVIFLITGYLPSETTEDIPLSLREELFELLDEQTAANNGLDGGGGRGIVIYLDFSTLHERTCDLGDVLSGSVGSENGFDGSEHSDYEYWSPATNEGKIMAVDLTSLSIYLSIFIYILMHIYIFRTLSARSCREVPPSQERL